MPEPGVPEYDPLLAVSLRLYVLCTLMDGRWRTLGELVGAVEAPAAAVVDHVKALRWAGYVETRAVRAGPEFRLTAAGAARLDAHLAALEAIVGKAARLSANARRRREASENVAVIDGGGTRLVRRVEVRFAEAAGDNSRLHTPAGVHLVREPLARLTRAWEPGFVRVHRRYLVALDSIDELRRDADGGWLVQTDCGPVPVSRRRAPAVRAKLLRRAR